jgi:hypothetical protein
VREKIRVAEKFERRNVAGLVMNMDCNGLPRILDRIIWLVGMAIRAQHQREKLPKLPARRVIHLREKLLAMLCSPHRWMPGHSQSHQELASEWSASASNRAYTGGVAG